MAVCSLCIAREDPFTPVIVPKDSIRPYYGETSVFDSAKIEFPSSARLIKKIEVTFQNIDGSIQTRSVAARGRIDWRMPLLISQVLTKNQIAQVKNIDNKTPPPSPKTSDKPKKTMVKSVDIPLESTESKETITRESADSARAMRIAGNAVDSAQDTSEVAIDNNIADDSTLERNLAKIDSQDLADKQSKQDDTQAQAISKPRDTAKNSTQDSTSTRDLATNAPSTRTSKAVPYAVNGNSIFISYEGGLKRHYIMQNPYRIVMDFEINTKYYKKNSYRINQPYFKRLRYGLHTHFLRIVLELDGSYVYTLEKHKNGVKINVQ